MPAAAAAKSLQSCLTLRDPMDCSPPGSSVHGIFQARVLEWSAIAFFSVLKKTATSRWQSPYMESPSQTNGKYLSHWISPVKSHAISEKPDSFNWVGTHLKLSLGYYLISSFLLTVLPLRVLCISS